jgi:exodeoxyribonuclease-3
LKIASWNVNSIRARQDRVLGWLDRQRPDVLCMQETKILDEQFPAEAYRDLGYESVFFGQKSYNGVAILSRHPIEDVRRGIAGPAPSEDPTPPSAPAENARVLAARIQRMRIVSVYAPNGETLQSEKYAFKLRFYASLTGQLAKALEPNAGREPTLLCGDFNIAPEPRDVYDPTAFENDVMFHVAARQALRGVLDSGFVDTYRLHHAEPGGYSWWDYRMLSFPKNRGVRIDLILATPDLAALCRSATIDRDARKGKLPSDHAPVLAEFDWQ